MTKYGFNAVVFDLDGVITKTALVHSAAWKKMFDAFLMDYSHRTSSPFREFTHANDYLPYVDGKPRYKGVESFLESRGIKLPWGDPSDGEDRETICGLGNRKNRAFNDVLASDGVEVYDSTVQLIHKLKEEGIRIGVASSSKNCEAVLDATGLAGLIETRVDGAVSAELGLHGKPEPDIFITACDRLGVPYDRAVIVEDAVSGVQAGSRGNFGLTLGIAREDNARELLENGADIVVTDISEIGFEGIVDWFSKGLVMNSWSITYHNYDPGREKIREALLTVGNGYFGTRGCMEEQTAGPHNYPGTYMAGVYNRLVSKVGDKDIENEDFVNCINWTGIQLKIDEGPWIDIHAVEILSIKRSLCFQDGVLTREMMVRDQEGRITRILSSRTASMADPHMAALEYTLVPLNYSGRITLRSSLSGDHINAGVDRYKQLNQQHLTGIESGGQQDVHYLVVETTQSKIRIANAATYTIYRNEKLYHPDFEYDNTTGRSEISFSLQLAADESLKIDKLVAIYTSRDIPAGDLVEKVSDSVMLYSTFNEVVTESKESWEKIWKKIDVQVTGDRLAQKLLRLHLFHTMVTASPNNTTLDAGLPARGLHGEAYRGHVFWDELFIMPLYAIHFPAVARALLMYRYRRLEAARQYAKEHGYRGAMFPWQSGSDGREETQTIHLNPVSGEWGPDHSSLQRHVSLAIAYNAWDYFRITGDRVFMQQYGAELFFAICRFWESKCKLNPLTGRYSIGKVMGPDEFHEKYPDADQGGLTDNAYTNLMVAWIFEIAHDLMNLIDEPSWKKLCEKTGLNEQEVLQWKSISGKMNLVISPDGIMSQYDGYFDLQELDWEHYKNKYGNIYRMDRLLKAEGKSPDEYKVAKQADTLMLFYNFDKQEVDRILKGMQYHLPDDYPERNLKYYLHRTSHGSTLSRVVHALLANKVGDHELSWTLYWDALTSDYQDIQGGTTAEGIHAGVMAGTVWIALSSFGGLNLKGDHVRIEPHLPGHWRVLAYSFTFRGVDYQCEVTHQTIQIKAQLSENQQVRVTLSDKDFTLTDSSSLEYPYTSTSKS
ncbi:MAG: beta-phosphoglucomutase family hydrolase [Bacteroidales bacterium]|nr:beta-phosphoglucomutase family hydrolase [Lentimicrobiaceae bacterium]MDD5694718.1 beta-phosphoglucomutase family hydrolase [Bacteroidales bacterium]